MEKISIVKRRKAVSQQTTDKQHFKIPRLTEIPSDKLKESSNDIEISASAFEESKKDESQDVSINLTPEQYNLIDSNQYIKYFLSEELSGVSLDVKKRQDGQIIFNFQFKKVDTVKMLSAKHVCQMLQISNSLLNRLIKTREIKCYKIGRVRRFLLEDILDYLSRSEEILEDPKT